MYANAVIRCLRRYRIRDDHEMQMAYTGGCVVVDPPNSAE